MYFCSFEIFFAASFFQDNSSESSQIIPGEFGEHLTGDQRPFLHTESPQIHVGASSLQFSPHSFSIGFRSGTGTAIADAWFCAQWSTFVLILMLVFWSLSCWKIQTWPFMRFLAEVVRFRFFLICWYLIESMMPYLNKMSRTSGRKLDPQH